MKLAGKVALITGGAKGIGKAMAFLFAEEGADISIVDWDLSSAEETVAKVKEKGRKAIAIKSDVADANDVDKAVEKTLKELGDIHILINCAGIAQQVVPTIETPVEHWDKVIGIHLRGTFLFCRRVGQWMVSQKRGKIVNLGSIGGLQGFSGRNAYGPAKAGVMYLAKALAVEWAKYNINVNAIAPGYVMTEMAEDLANQGAIKVDEIKKRTPLRRFARPEEIAKAALFLVSDDASYVTGVTLPVDGGWTAWGYGE